MAARTSVKTEARRPRCQIVGVITSVSALRQALEMSHPPNLFELRLDYLCGHEEELQRRLPSLPAGVIITARSASEGGVHDLSIEARGGLLLRYMDHAKYIDIELHSARGLGFIWKAAERKRIGRILSFHDFNSTPAPGVLETKAKRAQALGADLFKVATRTDSLEAVNRLVSFARQGKEIVDVSIMGMGRYGLSSRVALAELGSKLVYGAIGRPRFSGQPSLGQIRSALAAGAKRIS